MQHGGLRLRAALLASAALLIGSCGSSASDPVTGAPVTLEAGSTTLAPASASLDPSSPEPSSPDDPASAIPTLSDPAAAESESSPEEATGPDSTTKSDAGSDGQPSGGVPTSPGPAPGNGGGAAPVAGDLGPVNTSNPTTVVGTGQPSTCTGQAVVDAVAAGGIITFDCGPDPVAITVPTTAKVVNANGPEIVIDGGGKITLSGGGKRRILYMNTCDEAQGWTTSHCQNQDHPRLTVQNLTFADGNATGEQTEGGGGGAIFVRGGRLKIVNSTFVRNRCDGTGPDVGGAAVRVLSQFDGQPVSVVNSTFGGAPGQGGVCSNGGALSSIGVSWVVLNSVFTHNQAVGNGANPARGGTPGGGSGGAIYTDGNSFTVQIEGSRIEDNHANEGGGAVFFVSNDRSGTMTITDSVLRTNPSDGFETAGYPGIFFLGATDPLVTASTIE